MLTSGINFLKSLNELNTLIEKKSPEVLDRISEILVEHFQLQSALFFKISDNKNLILLSKSTGSKKSLLINSTYNCTKCKLLKENLPNLSFYTDASCEIQSTDFVIYEGCLKIEISPTQCYLLKVSQKTPFSQIDQETLRQIGKWITYILKETIEKSGQENSVGKLVVDISNELRTPTNSIVGFASLLNDDRLTSTQAEYVSTLRENAQKLLSLINDVIDIAKVENGLIQENLSETQLKIFLSDIHSIFIDRNDGKKAQIEINIDNSVPDNIKIDSQKLRLILINIIAYLFASDDNKKIKIDVSLADNGKIEFKISNPSLVLTAENVRNLFTSYGLSSLPSKGAMITPVGLVLVQKLINLLKGEINVISAAGKGTTIAFKLRIDTIASLQSQLISLSKSGDKNKVLVIEDDYATSKLLSNYLNKWGYEPIIVNSGHKALQMIEKEEFLAIITDIILPDINGLELLKRIREGKNTKHAPVIVCSVEAEQQKAFMMGAVEYFVKPIRYKDLVEVLTSYKLKRDSTVLCVDDDVPTLNLVKGAIESVGYTAIAEQYSTKVMDRISDKQIDLAIIDLDMPDLNGFQLIKLIKSNPKFANLPIIIYTGKENYEEDLKNIDGLFTELLSKRSTKIEDLADTINAMINKYEEPVSVEDAKKVEDSPKILLVEDYKHSQIIVTRLLKKNGYNTVVVVENGAEALETTKKQKFDLILMDMQMPVMNGFEATEKIRKLPEYQTTPIIALTAFAMKGDREKCLEAGATDYIPKPIDSNEFIEKVKYYTTLKFSSN